MRRAIVFVQVYVDRRWLGLPFNTIQATLTPAFIAYELLFFAIFSFHKYTKNGVS